MTEPRYRVSFRVSPFAVWVPDTHRYASILRAARRAATIERAMRTLQLIGARGDPLADLLTIPDCVRIIPESKDEVERPGVWNSCTADAISAEARHPS